MAQRTTAARGQEILDRWCALAEQRLEHLTDLFETGRWRRFHSEVSFLENIQEAKAAVETWRRLATREASLDNSVIDRSWLDRPKAVPPRRASFMHFPVQQSSSSPTSYSALKRLTNRIEKNDRAMSGKAADQPFVVFAPPIAAQPEPVTALPEREVLTDNAPPAPEMAAADIAEADTDISESDARELESGELDTPVANAAPELTLDLAVMQARYPLLRNAL